MNNLLIFLIVAALVLFILWLHKCPVCGNLFGCKCAHKMFQDMKQHHMKRLNACPCGCGMQCRCPIDCVCGCPRTFF